MVPAQNYLNLLNWAALVSDRCGTPKHVTSGGHFRRRTSSTTLAGNYPGELDIPSDDSQPDIYAGYVLQSEDLTVVVHPLLGTGESRLLEFLERYRRRHQDKQVKTKLVKGYRPSSQVVPSAMPYIEMLSELLGDIHAASGNLVLCTVCALNTMARHGGYGKVAVTGERQVVFVAKDGTFGSATMTEEGVLVRFPDRLPDPSTPVLPLDRYQISSWKRYPLYTDQAAYFSAATGLGGEASVPVVDLSELMSVEGLQDSIRRLFGYHYMTAQQFLMHHIVLSLQWPMHGGFVSGKIMLRGSGHLLNVASVTTYGYPGFLVWSYGNDPAVYPVGFNHSLETLLPEALAIERNSTGEFLQILHHVQTTLMRLADLLPVRYHDIKVKQQRLVHMMHGVLA